MAVLPEGHGTIRVHLQLQPEIELSQILVTSASPPLRCGSTTTKGYRIAAQSFWLCHSACVFDSHKVFSSTTSKATSSQPQILRPHKRKLASKQIFPYLPPKRRNSLILSNTTTTYTRCLTTGIPLPRLVARFALAVLAVQRRRSSRAMPH